MNDSKHKLLETVADIAYIAGVKRYYSGDSRADMADFIWWAREFEKANASTDWDREDYIIAIETFAEERLSTAVA